MGFVDLGSHVAFIDSAGANMVPASVAVGAMRGRVLTCETPHVASEGAVWVEVSLNGDAVGDAVTQHRKLRYTFVGS